MKKIIAFFSLILFGLNSLTSQTSQLRNNGFNNPIAKLTSTAIIARFIDYKNQIEMDASEFIARQNMYSTKDVARVQQSYDKTVTKYNQIWVEIKQDFVDKQKVKMIQKYPDMYANGLLGKIESWEKYYLANFGLTLSNVQETNGPYTPPINKQESELSQYFKHLKFEKAYMNATYLQEYLVAPHKIHLWDELLPTVSIRTDVKIHISRIESKN